MFTLGITGPVASGKSTVVNMLENLGAATILADKVAHELQNPNTSCTQKIVETFGPNLLAENGAIDRRKLGRLVANHPQKLATLNAIMHPAVREEVERRIENLRAQNTPFLVLEVPLLYQGGYDTLCDQVALCLCDEKIRKERALARPNMDEDKLSLFDSKQFSVAELAKKADLTFNTDLPQKETQAQVEALVKKVIKNG